MRLCLFSNTIALKAGQNPLLKSLCRLSVAYFLSAEAPRELKFCWMLRWYQTSIAESGILNTQPRSAGSWPIFGPLKLIFSEQNSNCFTKPLQKFKIGYQIQDG
jgi:hypothetical protein